MAEQSMMERVARAIYEMDASNRGCMVDWSAFEWTPNMRKAFFPAARAAIEAMRDADGDMYLAADELKDITFDGVWHAMIDAALSEDKK